MIGTHRLGDTPGEGGARERVTDVQGYTRALEVMIMVRDHDEQGHYRMSMGECG